MCIDFTFALTGQSPPSHHLAHFIPKSWILKVFIIVVWIIYTYFSLKLFLL
jgi:hypothetical protein